jgi:excinuclease ABC subunit C
VPGIGPVKRKALIRKFGSVRGLRGATLEELARVEGITPRLAVELKKALG